jgi:YVTN family beta-propeller protein
MEKNILASLIALSRSRSLSDRESVSVKSIERNANLLLGVSLLMASQVWAEEPGQSSEVTGLTTNEVVATIPVGGRPNDVVVSPDSATVYVANAASNTVSVIDAATNTVTFTIAVGRGPIALGLAPDGSALYVSNFRDGTVSVIDTTSRTITSTIPVNRLFAGLAVTPDGNQVYVCAAQGVSIIDTSSNAVTDLIRFNNSPLRVEFTPDGKGAYVLNTNSVLLIDTVSHEVTHRFTGIEHATVDSGMALCPSREKLYVTDSYTSAFSVINTRINKFASLKKLESSARLFLKLGRPAVTSSGNTLYIPVSRLSLNGRRYAFYTEVLRVDTRSDLIEEEITVGLGPIALGIAPDGKRAYVLNQPDSTVSVIDISGR